MKDYDRFTNQEWSENINLTKELGYSYIYKRLYELEDKIEQGTLIELPCKVGDTIYIVGKEIEEFIVSAIEITILSCDSWGTNTIQFTDKNGDSKFDYFVYFAWIGKTVFLTREEAEKKLKESQE